MTQTIEQLQDEYYAGLRGRAQQYKDEVMKLAGEPTCWMTPDGEGWRMRTEPPEVDTKLGWMPFFTADQLIATTARLEAEVERLRGMATVKGAMGLLADKVRQLAAAQEEIERLNALMLERNQEYFQQLAKAEQLWQVAQGRCDGLEEKLAKAEQRVAEACAKYVNRFLNGDGIQDEAWIRDIESGIRRGTWKEFK